ncbi:hypothetical protein [Macrococcus capreoli]|uniref:hypothetical protein n=1 Tax=Macrococcus capreoli TaxID=2982690 RepID=UPI0021D60224|nr:hypothetical protein [Macrococcus sp. TMW 2.2395]MCU7557098.1 hypothetical protein [Macrococcus sp. TMW 2.2395]
MKEEFLFFKENFLRTDVRVGIERYKKQRWIAFLMTVPIILLGVLLMWDDFSYSDAYFEMSEKAQLAYELKDTLRFAVIFYCLMLLVHVINLPNEIHRANMLNKNWRIRLWIIGAFFIFYIVLVAYFYVQQKPGNLQATLLLLLLSNFVFGGNPYATTDEEKLSAKQEV